MMFPDKTGPLCAKMDRGLSGQDGVNGMVVVTETSQSASATGNYTRLNWGGGAAGALNCMHDQQIVISDGKPKRKYIVRRLTPLECCRLQGFPDWWEDGIGGSDSERYRLWGNGMALPNMLYVMEGIKEALNGNK